MSKYSRLPDDAFPNVAIFPAGFELGIEAVLSDGERIRFARNPNDPYGWRYLLSSRGAKWRVKYAFPPMQTKADMEAERAKETA